MKSTPVRREGRRDTPRRLGYRMPAEWEKHEAIWLSWPHDTTSFPRLAKVEEAYARLIAAIHLSEEVRLLVRDESMRERAARLLREAKVDLRRVRFLVHEYADVWFRDYGPTFVVNRASGLKAMVRWAFNAWGGKYAELMSDAHVPDGMLREFPMPCFKPGIVMEGGSFDVNGKGALLTTQQCLLNKNRNPGLDRKDIERILGDCLGIDRVIWLKEGIAGDDTDGHVDDIARFVAEDTVLCAYEDDERDENHAPLRENFELLQETGLKILRLPMPGRVEGEAGRLPASYANFYIGNTVVLVPIFGQPDDAKALDIIQRCFPGRKAVGIRCEDLARGLGTLHCISQQEPAL